MTNSDIIAQYNDGEMTRDEARAMLVANGMDDGTAKYLTNGSFRPKQRKPIVLEAPPTTDRAYWRRYAECRRKRRFTIESHARAYRDRLAEQSGEAMKIYECRWCGCLHVAHANTKAKAA
jgi:hypothetical protein